MSRDYLVNWVLDTSRFMGPAQALEQELRELDALTDKVGAGLKGMTSGAARRINGVSTAADRLTKDFKELDTAADKAGVAVRGIGSGLRGSAGSANAFGGAVQNLVASVATFETLKRVAEGLGEALNKARQYAYETAEANIKLRDTLRELAALRGDTGPNDKNLAATLDLMVSTGATQVEAEKALTAAEQSLPIARQKEGWTITPEQEKEFITKGTAWAISKGLDPGDFLTSTSNIAIHEPITSTDQLLGKAAAAYQMKQEGLGDIGLIYKQDPRLLAQLVRPEGGGAFKSIEEEAAVFSAVSTVSGGEARTARAMDIVWREMQKPEARALGITSQDDYVSGMRKFGATIDAGRARGLSEQEALREKGFASPFAIQYIAAQVRQVDLMDAQRGRVAQFADPRQIDADVTNYRAEHPGRFADAQVFAADALKGVENEALMAARRSAEARLKGRGELGTFAAEAGAWIGDFGGAIPKFTGQEPMIDQWKDKEIRRQIREVWPEATKQFPGLSEHNVGTGNTGGQATGERLGTILRQLPPEVQARIFESPEIKAKIQALGTQSGTAGLRAPGAANPGAAAEPGPQAQIDGSDIKEGGKEFREGVREFRTLLASLKGGRGGVATRIDTTSGPYRPGSIG